MHRDIKSANIFFVNGNYSYAIKNNKIFNILIEKNQDNNQFIFSTKNHLKKVFIDQEELVFYLN